MPVSSALWLNRHPLESQWDSFVFAPHPGRISSLGEQIVWWSYPSAESALSKRRTAGMSAVSPIWGDRTAHHHASLPISAIFGSDHAGIQAEPKNSSDFH